MTTKLAAIKLLLLDVDGVLTDGHISVGDDGSEVRSYHAHDGIGIRLVKDAGIQIGVVTASAAAGISQRAEYLGIDHICLGIADKAQQTKQLAAKLGLELSAIAFMGDDLVDLAAMQLVGVAVAVADAQPTVREYADIVTTCNGGHGAVREFCELLVAACQPDHLAHMQQCGLHR